MNQKLTLSIPLIYSYSGLGFGDQFYLSHRPLPFQLQIYAFAHKKVIWFVFSQLELNKNCFGVEVGTVVYSLYTHLTVDLTIESSPLNYSNHHCKGGGYLCRTRRPFAI